jgi:hypothetical protein
MPEQLPKTIEDAMSVALDLGIPHLWVDRYCIDQNDDTAKQNTIRNMGAIYEGASLTIIAAAGNGPEYGLPGVRHTPRQFYFSHDFMAQLGTAVAWDDLIVIETPHSEVLRSKWNTRGWTYQEAFLSRRQLVFTDTQIYFQSETGNLLDSVQPRGNLLQQGEIQHSLSVFRMFNQTGHSESKPLSECLEEYFRTELSYSTDIIRAFTGIFNTFAVSGHDEQVHFYGIPCLRQYSEQAGSFTAAQSFAKDLAWVLYRDQEWERLTVIDDKFPSWTWAHIKANRSSADLPWLRSINTDSTSDSMLLTGLQVSLTHRTHGQVEFSTYAKGFREYDEFCPHIDITSWTVPCRIQKKWTRESTVELFLSDFVGSGTIWLDYPVPRPCYTLFAMLVNIDSFWYNATLLLVEEANDNTYRRIGVYVSDKLSLFKEFFDLWMELRENPPDTLVLLQRIRPKNDWQLRTLRLV